MLSLPSIDDPARVVLVEQVRTLSKFVGYANIVVAVGVALEGLELAYRFFKWVKRRIRESRERVVHEEVSPIFPAGELIHATESHFEEPGWLKALLYIGLLGVVGGVVGEWKYGARLEDAHDAVNRYDLGKLVEAEHKIVVLEPRWMLLEAHAPEVVELKPFVRQELIWVRCSAQLPPPEPERVGQDLLRILGSQGANWSIQAPVAATWLSCTNGATSAGGNLVIVNSDSEATVKSAAKALADALNGSQVWTINAEASNDQKTRNFMLGVLGPGNPWVLAIDDPKAVVFLVGSNPSVDVDTLKKSSGFLP